MKKSKLYFLVFVFGLLLNACTYDFIVVEELPTVNPNVDVLFATQIAPIFTACVSCHKTGGQAPDLSVAASACKYKEYEFGQYRCSGNQFDLYLSKPIFHFTYLEEVLSSGSSTGTDMATTRCKKQLIRRTKKFRNEKNLYIPYFKSFALYVSICARSN